jgi:hypothetical protein
MLGDNWFLGIDPIRRAFETGDRGTVLGVPGRLIARLPDALGGDSKQWRLLTAPVKGKPGFFALLLAKAHFLMLPKRIAEFIKESERVLISEAAPAPGGLAETLEESSSSEGRWAEMRIPGASDGLVWAGHDLGREALDHPRVYSIVGRIYHEMTHSLLWLQQYADADIQKLFADGLLAYQSAVGARGTTLPAHRAFTEAAGYYVEDMIYRWCSAISRLNSLLLKPPEDLDRRRADLRFTVEEYDKFVSVYGVVGGEKIDSPALSAELRDAINQRILDGLQLTKPFDDTALAGLRASLLSRW